MQIQYDEAQDQQDGRRALHVRLPFLKEAVGLGDVIAQGTQAVGMQGACGMILSTGLGDTAQVTSLLNQAAARYNLPPSLLLSVARTESNLNPNAVSPAGAQGVMQLMPATAAGLGVSDPFDPAQNIDGGAKYLSQLLTQFHGDTSLALAAYNAGPGNVNKYGGIPPFPETQAYVSKVLAGAGDMSTGFYDDSTPSPDVPSSDSSDNSMLLALAVLGGVGLVWALS
jgi:hypothetical protein